MTNVKPVLGASLLIYPHRKPRTKPTLRHTSTKPTIPSEKRSVKLLSPNQRHHCASAIRSRSGGNSQDPFAYQLDLTGSLSVIPEPPAFGATMQKKACGTCRERKLLCDLSVPICQRCSRSKRICNGYGLRLSWPKTKDSKRAVLATTSRASQVADPGANAWLVNASMWDLEVHDYLSNLALKGRTQFRPPVMPASLTWNPLKLSYREKDLLQYFESVASFSLTTYGNDSTEFRNILLRMASSDGAPSAKAVMQSLLAFSSMHRFGSQTQTTKLKLAAIRSLHTSLGNGMDRPEALQHVAAGMLLSILEAQQATATPNTWILYFCGVKDIIRTARLMETSLHDHVFIALMYWVFYHDALSAFSFLHWRRYLSVEEAYIQEIGEGYARCRAANCVRSTLPNAIPPSLEILGILMGTCDLINKPFDPQDDGDARAEKLTSFQRHLTKLPMLDIAELPLEVVSGTKNAEAIDTELYRLATSVFLARSTGFSKDGRSASQWTDKAFALFSRLSTYDRGFPLLIFGLEAQTDTQRIAILELIARSEEHATVRNLRFVKSLIQSSWVQDELQAFSRVRASVVDYTDKLTVLISSSEQLPTFV